MPNCRKLVDLGNRDIRLTRSNPTVSRSTPFSQVDKTNVTSKPDELVLSLIEMSALDGQALEIVDADTLSNGCSRLIYGDKTVSRSISIFMLFHMYSIYTSSV